MLRHALALALIACLTILGHEAGLLAPLKNWLVELRFKASPRPVTGDIVLVEIDAKSIATVGDWPWPRRVHADLIGKLRRLGAAEIGLDIDFSARSNDADDAALEAALRDAEGSVLLAAFNQRLSSASHTEAMTANRPLPRFREHSWPASVNVRPDSDGLVRRYPFGAVIDGETIPSMAALYGGAARTDGDLLIDFSIAAEALDHVSAIDLLQGRTEPGRIAGKKIIVGATAVELRDFFQVPAHELISGALLQAAAAETILQGRALTESGRATSLAGIVVIAGVVLLAGRGKGWRSIVGGLAAAAVFTEAAAAALQAWRPIVLDTSAWQAMLLGTAALTTAREIDLRRILLSISTTETRNTQALLDQVISDNFDGIIVADEAGTIHSVSRAALSTLHPQRADTWTSRVLSDLAPPEMTQLVVEAARACAEGTWQEAPPRELSLNFAGLAERTLEYVVTPSRLAGGLGPGGKVLPDRFVACLTFRDITERRLAEKRLAYLARFDTLTGLPNRNYFMERLGEAAEFALSGSSTYAAFYLDLDRFKTINDTLGHGVGDMLLQAVARRSQEAVPAPHVLARFGGDEFAVLWLKSATTTELQDAAQHLIDDLSRPYDVGGHRLSVGVSIGIALIDTPGKDLATIMKNADTALYRAKNDGGGSFRFFDASMDVALQARQKLEVELWDAHARGEFEVHYQPQFDLGTRRLTGVEALLRWRHPSRGFVSPAEFIPVAEEIGLMTTLGEWVLRQACMEVSRWPGAIKLAVNVSPVQFTRGDLIAMVDRALAASGLPAHQLELEITESLFIQENGAIRASMDELGARGIAFALDDFGTGYSSLSYIRKFPIAKIKIDRSFVSGIPHDREAIAIIQAVVALAANLGIRTNAEGLETTEQITLLHLLGCNEGQGYGLGRPQPGEDIVRMIRESAAPAGIAQATAA